MSKESTTETAGQGPEQEMYVFLEHDGDELAPVSVEILGEARRLADPHGYEVVGLLAGHETEYLAKEALAFGADRVQCYDSELLAHYSTDGYAHVIGEVLADRRPNFALFGATNNGRDLAGRLAVRLQTGLTADVTALDMKEGGIMVGEVPGFGGGIIALVLCPEARPQMFTVRPGIFEGLPKGEPTGEIEQLPVSLKADMIQSEVLEVERVELEDITKASVVVAGGGGVDGNFGPLREVADLLGGAIGATRVAVDNGWITRDYQIGQTGLSIRPKVCICAGISGAVQFTCGITGSDLVIAIDRDPNPHKIQQADNSVVGDLFPVMEALIAELAAIKAGEAPVAVT